MLLLSTVLLAARVVLAAPTCARAGSSDTVTLYLSPSTIAGLQLALHLENLEVNFFQSAIANVTSSDVGQGISNVTLNTVRETALVNKSFLSHIPINVSIARTRTPNYPPEHLTSCWGSNCSRMPIHLPV
jgi:hypothetical protein